ncbi:MAG: DNA-binding protein WhiA [Clostridiales bacterium]|jgi:DNA-binding protein WhiA|nr:DNA-binding protein WhiA [Clostridiales bacterium]
MSFSKNVKEELSLQINDARHCRIAELAAVLTYGGQVISNQSHKYLRLQTENPLVARKYFTLIKKTFNISIDISIRNNQSIKDNKTYILIIKNQDIARNILKATKQSDYDIEDGRIGNPAQMVLQNTCCKRAFIRGAFLMCGSMSNPKKAYHLEFVTDDPLKAERLQELICTFSIDAKIILRKKYYVVYIKEGSGIVDLLNVMEAHVSLMDLENVRILKEMRNQVNRQVNCEAANINKTVEAASKQIDDIIYIRDYVGFSNLNEGLRDIARLRVEHPEASLKELGTMLLPPIGKSGVNHRLRKLSMIAEYYREHKEESINDKKRNSN